MTDFQRMVRSRVTPDVGAGRIMTTDGGHHPGALWAQVAVDDLCSVGPALDPAHHSAALRMKADMVDLLEPLFEKVMERERDELHDDFSRMVAGVDPAPHVEDMLAEIMKASKGTRWESLFAEAMNVVAIRQLLSQHIATVLLGERSWHADRNPEHELALAFRDMHHPMSDYVTTDDDRELAFRLNLANSPGGV